MVPSACPSKPSSALHHRVVSGCKAMENAPHVLQVLQANWSWSEGKIHEKSITSVLVFSHSSFLGTPSALSKPPVNPDAFATYLELPIASYF